MRRRALVGITASAMELAGPALAQAAPEVRWRLASSFPRSLMPWSGAEFLAQRVAELTDGRFRIQCSAAGEVVPSLQVLDAAAQGGVEVAHTVGLYFIGKDSAFAFAATVPFMMNPRQQNAWLYHGGGNGMLDELFGQGLRMKSRSLVSCPTGDDLLSRRRGSRAWPSSGWLGISGRSRIHAAAARSSTG